MIQGERNNCSAAAGVAAARRRRLALITGKRDGAAHGVCAGGTAS